MKTTVFGRGCTVLNFEIHFVACGSPTCENLAYYPFTLCKDCLCDAYEERLHKDSKQCTRR